jgi:D-alanine transaminase
MSRIAYVNGRYVLHMQAMVSIDDRGYQFGDGVYEVCEVFRGELVDELRHMTRLTRSLAELRMDAPCTAAALEVVLREVVRRNNVSNGYVYVQVTRGVAPREHRFPPPNLRPSLIVTARSVDRTRNEFLASRGVAVITVPDIRWQRVDIKTISLIPNVLARQTAKERGADEAWFLDSEGMVTEGAASNAWIIDRAGTIVTRKADHSILAGVTRTTLIEIIHSLAMTLEERKFSRIEALSAREAFITGATSLVTPVVAIDDQPINDGRPGPITQKLRSLYHDIAVMTRC